MDGSTFEQAEEAEEYTRIYTFLDIFNYQKYEWMRKIAQKIIHNKIQIIHIIIE
jgi:aspartyl/asparaginyl beta-hydroxylase (cupin superfamily)